MAIVHPSNDKIRSSGDDSRRSFIWNTLFLSISELTASHVDHVHVHKAVPDMYGQPIGLGSQPKPLIDQTFMFELVTKNKDDGHAHDIKRCFFFTAKAYYQRCGRICSAFLWKKTYKYKDISFSKSGWHNVGLHQHVGLSIQVQTCQRPPSRTIVTQTLPY